MFKVILWDIDGTLLDFLKRNNDENEYQSDYIKNDWKIRRTDHVKK